MDGVEDGVKIQKVMRKKCAVVGDKNFKKIKKEGKRRLVTIRKNLISLHKKDFCSIIVVTIAHIFLKYLIKSALVFSQLLISGNHNI